MSTQQLSLNDIQGWLLDKSAHILLMSYDDINCDSHLSEIGMDSQEVFALIGELESHLKCQISPSILEDLGSINHIAQHAYGLLQQEGAPA